MKIIYFHQYFKTPNQAGGTRSYEMAKRLVVAGHEVHVITSSTDEKHLKSAVYQVDGINVHSRSVRYNNRMGFYRRVLAFFEYVIFASGKGLQIKGDVVFASSTPLTVIIPAYFAARRSASNLVFEVRDLWPKIPIAMGFLKNSFAIKAATALERFAYSKAIHIVALSDGMKKGVVDTGVASEKVTVIPNSADLDLFDPVAIREGAFRREFPFLPQGPIVLYPGTIGMVNGVSYLVDVAGELLGKSDVSFVVIGDGSELEMVVDRSKRNGTFEVNLFFFKPQPKNVIVHAFRDASMVISLVIDVEALEANSANKLFDGMAAGRALAVNYGGWQKDLIEKEGLGLVLSRDARAAAGEIINFFENSGNPVECGKRARSAAERFYSRDDLARKLERVLSDACHLQV